MCGPAGHRNCADSDLELLLHQEQSRLLRHCVSTAAVLGSGCNTPSRACQFLEVVLRSKAEVIFTPSHLFKKPKQIKQRVLGAFYSLSYGLSVGCFLAFSSQGPATLHRQTVALCSSSGLVSTRHPWKFFKPYIASLANFVKDSILSSSFLGLSRVGKCSTAELHFKNVFYFVSAFH